MAPVDLVAHKVPGRKNMYISAITASFLQTTIGCVTAWPSAAIPILRKQGLTETQETWMVSLSMLGSCLGPTLFTVTVDRLGRKYSLLLSNTIYIISWATLALANGNAYALCTGRFIGGLANGFSINIVAVYITEIADVKMRQTLTSLIAPSVSLGLLIQYAVGPWLSYEAIILVSCIPIVLVAVGWFRIKESPYHLVAKGKIKEATDVLLWLNGTGSGVREELERIERLVKEMRDKSSNKMDLFLKKGPRKALLLSSLLLFIQPFSGVDVIGSYLDPILSQTSLPFSHQVATVIVGVFSTACACCEPLFVHRFGSKWTMVVSSFFCVSSLICFGIYKYFDERHYNVSSFTATPIICVMAFELFFGLGYGSLPWAISAELYPPSLKGFGINIITTMNCIMAFVAIKLYGDLSPVIGASWYFIVTGAFFICGDILVAIVLPNTAGKSLDEIQQYLNRS